MSGPAQALYDRDFFRWTVEQGRLLREAGRSGLNVPLDWENLAEEVESLGRSDRRELRSRISTIVVHLLKLAASPAVLPRGSWKATVREQRAAINKDLLRDSPSLRAEVGPMITEALEDAAEIARDQLSGYGELSEATRSKLAAVALTEEQVLGDWLPGEP